MRYLLICAIAASGMLAGAPSAQEQPDAARPSPAEGPSHPTFGRFGLDEAGMDKSVKPGDDFYAYANSTWSKITPIPPEKANLDMFGMLDDLSSERVRSILEAARGDSESQIGRAYASYLDTATVEAKGLAPIQPWLNRIRSLKERAGYSTLVAEATRMGIRGPYSGYVGPDDKIPTRAILLLRQDGLGMPDRDIYLLDKPAYRKLRAAYVAHVAAMLKLIGEPDADARAQAVLAMETRIASAQWTREDSTDSGKTYNKFKIAETGQFSTPTLNLTAILKSLNPAMPDVQVSQPSAFTAIATIMESTPLQVLKDQLLIRSLDDLSPVLADKIRDETFAFYGTIMLGTQKMEPRWKRGVGFMNRTLGDAVGKEYVARYFPPEYKAEMDKLIANVIAAFDARIGKLEWMQPETRQQARTKLAGFNAMIGYPERWRDYSGLEIKADDLFGNQIRANRFNYQYMIDKAGKPFRKWEWWMLPQTANAHAMYSQLQIFFPAAILQPPFFDPKADMAVNYGAIGAVIGHEISHHFDDQGSQYNERGVLQNWWAPEDLKAFKTATKGLVAQYDAYEVLPSEHVKGEFTLGENIGDLAGLTMAYDAYHLALGGKPAPEIDGYSGDQRFFLGWAQFWRRNYREADLRQRLLTDGHPPSTVRPWIVRNLDAWYKAFDVKPGDKLYLEPTQRVRIW